MLNKRQLKNLASKAIKDGPVVATDSEGHEYWAYVVFVRDGVRCGTLFVDEDIATLNHKTMDFMVAEISHFVKATVNSPIRLG